MFQLDKNPFSFFKQRIQKDGEEYYDRMLIVTKYIGGGYKSTKDSFCKRFRNLKQYKPGPKQPWFREGLTQGRGKTFVVNSIEKLSFTKEGIIFDDKRKNNHRPEKFTSDQAYDWAELVLELQRLKNYSQFKTWKEITYPKQISYSQFNKRVSHSIGTGYWSKNKSVKLTESHKDHREKFGKQVLENQHEHFWSTRFKKFMDSVFQDEALFPGKTPFINPRQLFKYDLFEPDPDKKVGHKPSYSRSQYSIMYSIAFSRHKKFQIEFFTQYEEYKRPQKDKKGRFVPMKNIEGKDILKIVIKRQLEPEWEENYILVWDGARTHDQSCIDYIKNQSENMDCVEVITKNQDWDENILKYPSLSPDFMPCEKVHSRVKDMAFNFLFEQFGCSKVWTAEQLQMALTVAWELIDETYLNSCIDDAVRKWKTAGLNKGEWSEDVPYVRKHKGHVANGRLYKHLYDE